MPVGFADVKGERVVFGDRVSRLGYLGDHAVERYMCEPNVMQIFEGTKQFQSMAISPSLARRSPPAGVRVSGR